MPRMILIVLSLGLSAVFGFFFYAQYFKWRHCFNDLGRCYDPDAGVVYRDQSGAIWGALAVFALVAGVVQAWKWHQAKR